MVYLVCWSMRVSVRFFSCFLIVVISVLSVLVPADRLQASARLYVTPTTGIYFSNKRRDLKEGIAGGVELGVLFNKRFALRAEYYALGSRRDSDNKASYHGYLAEFGASYNFWAYSKFVPKVSLGIAMAHLTKSYTLISLGFGVDYRISKSIAVGVAYKLLQQTDSFKYHDHFLALGLRINLFSFSKLQTHQGRNANKKSKVVSESNTKKTANLEKKHLSIQIQFFPTEDFNDNFLQPEFFRLARYVDSGKTFRITIKSKNHCRKLSLVCDQYVKQYLINYLGENVKDIRIVNSSDINMNCPFQSNTHTQHICKMEIIADEIGSS
ncbi:MAG: hypothetical protein COB50_03050 [Thiotrichales bacterium]|nr:MAG: hypothetical protein COB50_03050 [Thiotrichales bacterium]